MLEVRLIDANALKEDIDTSLIYGLCARFDEIVERQPTIEIEPVRHAQWINDTFCSNCKRFPVPVDVSASISNQALTKYFSRCPHCGARMRKDG